MNDRLATFHRRNFLRGAGIALALPWLESLSIASPVPDATPKRFMSVYHPDGVGLPLRTETTGLDQCATFVGPRLTGQNLRTLQSLVSMWGG